MKQILVASDFSNCAGNALDYALELGRILDFEICVIHAIGSTEGVGNSTYRAIYIEDYYNNKREALKTWTASIAGKDQFKDVKVVTLCEVGTVSAVISKYLSTHPVELLVMGTMGSTGITGLFGSNTGIVVEKVKTATLVIPLESKFAVNPVITLATDFSTDLSTDDLRALDELTKALGSKELTILNIVEGTDWKINEQGEKMLRELIPGVELNFRYISESNAHEGIINFIISNNTDILCVVKHHHNVLYRLFNRSTVNQVMNRSIKAVLVLHE